MTHEPTSFRDRLLAVDRFERYQSAGELLAALDAGR